MCFLCNTKIIVLFVSYTRIYGVHTQRVDLFSTLAIVVIPPIQIGHGLKAFETLALPILKRIVYYYILIKITESSRRQLIIFYNSSFEEYYN